MENKLNRRGQIKDMSPSPIGPKQTIASSLAHYVCLLSVLSPVIGGPSDLGGFDSAERMLSFWVGRAGLGQFRGQV